MLGDALGACVENIFGAWEGDALLGACEGAMLGSADLRTTHVARSTALKGWDETALFQN